MLALRQHRYMEAHNLITSSKHFHKPSQDQIWVGKDILELISGGMYTHPLSMLREYIQNACDSIDQAYSTDVISFDEHRIDIKINKENNKRSLVIRDNGLGIESSEFAKRMLSIGGSQKRGTSQRGFRGVGRFAALSFCRQLTFRTSAKGEKTISEARWDGVKFKSALRSNDKDYDLRRIINEICELSDSEECEEEDHFFEVEIGGVVRLQNDKLMNGKLVYEYLGQVAPVPFSAEFSYATKINEYLDQYGEINWQYNIYLDAGGEPEIILKPYENELYLNQDLADPISEIEFLSFDNMDGEKSVVGWVAHSSYLGALPRSSLVKGIRVRDGNVQIGDSNLLTQAFAQARFNSWSVGELHVLNKSLTPTARRDEFETDSSYADFQNKFAAFTATIEARCRVASSNRNIRKLINSKFSKIDLDLDILKQGTVTEVRMANLLASASSTLEEVEKDLNKISSSEDYNNFKARFTRRSEKIAEYSEVGVDESDFFVSMKPQSKKLYTEVFDLLYKHISDKSQAQNLVSKLMRDISRN